MVQTCVQNIPTKLQFRTNEELAKSQPSTPVPE